MVTVNGKSGRSRVVDGIGIVGYIVVVFFTRSSMRDFKLLFVTQFIRIFNVSFNGVPRDLFFCLKNTRFVPR